MIIRGIIISILLALSAAAIWSVVTGQTRFAADINALFPASDRKEIEVSAYEALQAQNGRQISIFAGHADEARLISGLSHLKEKLYTLSNLTVREASDEEATRLSRFIRQNAGLIATEDDFKELQSGNGSSLIQRTLLSLFLPGSLITADQLRKDPLALSTAQINMFAANGNASFLGEDGVHYVQLSLLLQEDLSPDAKKATFLQFKEVLNVVSKKHDGFSLVATGAPFYENQIAEKSKTEALFLSIGATVGVILLLLFAFRSARVISGALLIITGGILSGAVATLLIFNTVHLIAVAFGSSLIGVVVDYAIHFYAARRLSEPMAVTAERIRLGLVLGAGTSIIGFIALLFSNMIFLQQIAVYSTFGVVGAALTVLFLLPILSIIDPKQSPSSDHNGVRKLHITLTPIALFPALGLASALSAALLLLNYAPSSDSVRNLRVSTEAIDKLEQQISKLGANSSNRIVLIQGNSAEEILQREEQLKAELFIASDQSLRVSLSLSDFLPSLKRQEEIASLTKEVMATKEAAPLLSMIGDLEADRTFVSLDPAVIRQLPMEIQGLRIEHNEIDQQAHLMILPGSANDAYLAPLLSKFAWATELDVTRKYTSDMARMRLKATQTLIAGIIFANLIFIIRFGVIKGLQALVAPSAATLLALLAIAYLTPGLSFFSVIAGFLIFALGADYALFQMASQDDDRDRAYKAVTLSALSTVLVFGLMSFSSIPVLQTIGSTIVIGVVCAWGLSPLAIASKKE
ncbi:MMPL family transporter [Sneathiella sp. P13V-1]|uniref:MMPL family transporter n=1 Tax=Sneathiella sp. P13V-1 TaxID=2697366 RepID=UPI001D128593|nr:MMPL family transporter [Sneathiella sp. P13V-1]